MYKDVRWQRCRCTGLEVAAIVGVAVSAATTTATLAKGTPSPPPVPEAPASPPQAPPPPSLPPAPSDATTGDVALATRQRARRAIGQDRTILTTPLGVAGARNKTLLGG
jgi:hypothetical protein